MIKRKLNKGVIALFLLIITACSVKAQTMLLTGTVLNADNKDFVAGAAIYEVGNINNATLSNGSGNFSLVLKSGIQLIVCSLTGMKSDTLRVTAKNNDTLTHVFRLISISKNLNIVVVSASKYEQKLEDITVSMEVIKAGLIENKNTVNITSVLEQTPGLTILDQEPQIRGGSGFSFGVGSRVATLIDGLPILTGDAGRTDWQFIPVENIDQIEVVKGASSVLYGSSALSGTINFRTAYPKARFKTYVRTYGGVYDAPENKTAKWWDGPANFSGINVLHAERINRLDVVLGLNAVYDHGYIGPPLNISTLPLTDTTIQPNDVASRWGRANFNLRYRFSDRLSAGVNGNFMQSHSNFSLVWANDSNGIYNAFPKTMTLTDADLFYLDPFLNYTSPKAGNHTLKARISYANNNNGNNQSNKTNLYMGEYRFNKEFVKWAGVNVTAGLFSSKAFSDANLYSGSGSPKNTAENYAVFTQLEKSVFKILKLSAGFRGEYFETNDGDATCKPIMRAGANLRLTKGTFFRASYGQGYRYPTLTEKFIQTNTGGIDVFSNPTVKPETSWNAEAGIKQGFKIGSFLGFADVAIFRQRYNNTIEYIYAIWDHDTLENNLIGFKFTNTGKTQVQGIEFSLMGEGKIYKNISVAVLGGYTFTEPTALEPDYVFARDNPDPNSGFLPDSMSYKSTSTDTSGNTLKYRFKNLAKVDIEITWKFISVGYSLRYYSFMQNIDKTFYRLDESGTLPTGIIGYRKNHPNGALVHDLRMGIKINKIFKAAVLANNFLNNSYSLRPLKIESPRTFTIQLTAEF